LANPTHFDIYFKQVKSDIVQIRKGTQIFLFLLALSLFSFYDVLAKKKKKKKKIGIVATKLLPWLIPLGNSIFSYLLRLNIISLLLSVLGDSNPEGAV
jgi:hypothetical protein